MLILRRVSSLWNVVLIFAIIVFVACVGYIVVDNYRYHSANEGYEKIATQAFNVNDTEINDVAQSTSPLANMTVDWDYLRSINSDIVAWIYYPDTRINYPVVQGETNGTYIHTDFAYQDGFTAIGGAIFMESDNHPDFSDSNTFIYGHHMNDGSMFACLSTQLSYQDEFNAHRDFYVLTPNANYHCRSFAIDRIPGSEAVVITNFKDEESRVAYIQDKIDRSVVRPDEGFPAAKDVGKVVALATCDYNENDSRAVLYAQIVEQEKPSDNINGAIRTEELTEAQNNMAVQQPNQ